MKRKQNSCHNYSDALCLRHRPTIRGSFYSNHILMRREILVTNLIIYIIKYIGYNHLVILSIVKPCFNFNNRNNCKNNYFLKYGKFKDVHISLFFVKLKGVTFTDLFSITDVV